MCGGSGAHNIYVPSIRRAKAIFTRRRKATRPSRGPMDLTVTSTLKRKSTSKVISKLDQNSNFTKNLDYQEWELVVWLVD